MCPFNRSFGTAAFSNIVKLTHVIPSMDLHRLELRNLWTIKFKVFIVTEEFMLLYLFYFIAF